MRILFWGTPAFAVPSLRALLDEGIRDEGIEVVGVVTQPDRPAGRGRKLRPSALKQVALERGLLLAPQSFARPDAKDGEEHRDDSDVDLGREDADEILVLKPLEKERGRRNRNAVEDDRSPHGAELYAGRQASWPN